MKFKKLLKKLEESTLEYHDTLNPDLWEGNTLKQEVANKLTMIAHTWASFAKIPSEAITDIIIVGGNANFNYTAFSDIDLHLVVDTEQIADCTEFLEDYLRGKKQLWSLVHNIKIHGHPVEVYAQDVNTPYTKGQGVYSIQNKEWINEPEKHEVDLQDPAIQKKVDHYADMIDTLIDTGAEDESFETLKEKLRNMRSSALKQGGEFSFENLVFKELRNQGHLDRMTKYLHSSQDKRLSL
jgi:predicted nucleotidyltransferase